MTSPILDHVSLEVFPMRERRPCSSVYGKPGVMTRFQIHCCSSATHRQFHLGVARRLRTYWRSRLPFAVLASVFGTPVECVSYAELGSIVRAFLRLTRFSRLDRTLRCSVRQTLTECGVW